MSNEKIPSAKEIGRAVGEQISPELRKINESIRELKVAQAALVTAMESVRKEVKDLKATTLKIEILKAEEEKEHLKIYSNILENRVKDVEKKYFMEYERVKKAYLKSVLDSVRKFSESVRRGAVNIRPLTSILDAYRKLREHKQNVLLALNTIHEVHESIFRNRIKEITKIKDDVIEKMKEFLRKREEIAEQINRMKLDIDLKMPTIVNIPFWIIGIEDKKGNEEILVLPIMERMEGDGVPSEASPYVEHLRVPDEFDFSDAIREIKKEEIVTFARKSASKLDKDSIISALKKMKERGYVNEVFIEAVDKFWR